MEIKLKETTPLEKAVAVRVRRGIELLDKVTPGWFRPINPRTLKVSNREFCVFAQAKHEFKAGIVQVAEEAIRKGVKGVRLLKDQDLARITGFTQRWDNYKLDRMARDLHGVAVDVFYYGFDVDAELRQLTPSYRSWREGGGSRREAWDALDAAWQAVVVQKKQGEERKKTPSPPRRTRRVSA
jgi:hypothetical protein